MPVLGWHEVEWCKLYHVYVAEKESERRTRAALRWYQFGAPWEGMVVDVAGARPCMPQGNRRYLPEATGRPPGEELPQTSPEAVAARWRNTSDVECRQVERLGHRGGGRGCDGWKQSAREGTADDERE